MYELFKITHKILLNLHMKFMTTNLHSIHCTMLLINKAIARVRCS